MKRNLLSLFVLMTVAFCLVSCNSNTPKKTADKWLNSFYHMDYKEAKTVSTEETKKVLDMIEQFSTMVADSQKQNAKKIKIDIKDVKEEGDNATVKYITSENKQEQKLNLVKQNGKWLVKFSKQDNGDGNAPAQNAEEPASADTAAAPATEVPATTTDTAK